MSTPLIAIVGAPNVGKSTLFNRLVGGRRAIVTDEPGVTRDRLYGRVDDDGRTFRLVDTGGLTPNTAAPFAGDILRQAETAMAEAAVLLLVVDVRAGLTAVDHEVALLLRRKDLPILLVANKADSLRLAEEDALALYELGLGEPIPVSAEHGLGIGELLSAIHALLGDPAGAEHAVEDEEGPASIDVAIVGRPNVGKSSLMNRLAGEERALVSDIPGTTRDSIDTLLELGDRHYRLIDTAGIRRPGKLRHRAERFSVVRARHNIERCHVAVLVLDGSQPFAAQDAHIAGLVQDSGKPLVVAVNKWDKVEEREQQAKAWMAEVRDRLRFVKEAPIVLVSALTGQRVHRVLDAVDALNEASLRRIPTPQLNRLLQEVAGSELEASPRGRSIRLYYATQTGVRPPRFTVFCNDPRKVHFSFRRYLENRIRERFEFGGAPIRLRFRGRKAGER